MGYWLLKSEPNVWSIEQQKKVGAKGTTWDGVRNYQAANNLKQMKKGGTIVSIELKGGIDVGRQFLNNLKMCSLSANLGDTRTIATHPASTTHSKLCEEDRQETGITDGLVRISVGLEHIADIISDIEQALQKIKL